MDWVIPAKLKKRVSYAQFSFILSRSERPGLFFIRQWRSEFSIIDGSLLDQGVKPEIAAEVKHHDTV
jgi:hypothetical protein